MLTSILVKTTQIITFKADEILTLIEGIPRTFTTVTVTSEKKGKHLDSKTKNTLLGWFVPRIWKRLEAPSLSSSLQNLV